MTYRFNSGNGGITCDICNVLYISREPKAHELEEPHICPDCIKREEFHKLGLQVEKFFPGYKLDSFNPGLRFSRSEEMSDGRYHYIDSFTLSVMAAKCLVECKEPERVIKKDLYEY